MPFYDAVLTLLYAREPVDARATEDAVLDELDPEEFTLQRKRWPQILLRRLRQRPHSILEFRLMENESEVFCAFPNQIFATQFNAIALSCLGRLGGFDPG